LADTDSERESLAEERDASQEEHAGPEPVPADAAGSPASAAEAGSAAAEAASVPDPAGNRSPDPDAAAPPEPGAAGAAGPAPEATPVPGRRAGRGRRGRRAGGGRRRRLSWRTPVSALLIVLGCIFAPVSVIAVWGVNQVTNTSRYIDNIEPLIHEPAIQNALTDKVTTAITSKLNLVSYTNQAAAELNSKGLSRVSALLKSVGPSLASAVAGYVHTEVHKIVTSPRFARIWIQVNTAAHQTLVNVLSGQSKVVGVQNGKIIIQLAPIIDAVKHDLSAQGFSLVNKLPPIHPTLAVYSATGLVKAQKLYRLANDLKILLPILTLVLLAAGVFVARRRRRALIGAGLGFAASMLVLGLGLLLFRSIYLSSIPSSELPSDAASALFDTFVRFIRTALRTLLVLGLVVAAGAFLTGPSAAAVGTRRVFTSAFAWVRGAGERQGVSTGPVGRWTYAHRMALRISAVALAALIFVFWGRPTALVVILLAVLLLVVLGLIELIGRPPPRPEAASQP
jgi:hypothetical protein